MPRVKTASGKVRRFGYDRQGLAAAKKAKAQAKRSKKK